MQIITNIARSVVVWPALLTLGTLAVVRSAVAIVSAYLRPCGNH